MNLSKEETKIYRQNQYQKHKHKWFTDEALAKRKEYRDDNKEKLRLVSKSYYNKNKQKEKESAAKYYLENKQNILAYNKNWYTDNKEKFKEITKNWRMKNPEAVKKLNIQWRKLNPEKDLEIRLKARYNITLENYNEMIKVQNNCCIGCGISAKDLGKKLHIDHCHKSTKVRGLLCFNCNSILGHAKDRVIVLQNLVDYLTTDNLQKKAS